MSRIKLNLPSQAKVIGSLHTTEKLHNLDQDMIYIELPGDIVIDIGWYPDRDPKGEYRLVVFQGAFDQQIEKPIHTKNYRVIVAEIGRLVSKYLPPVLAIGSPFTSGSAEVNGKVLHNPAPAIDFPSNATNRTVFVFA